MSDLPIILASSSPRRHELLRHLVDVFTVLPVNVDESKQVNESPVQYIQRMVNAKAQASVACLNADDGYDSFANLPSPIIPKNTDSLLILTADTIGVLPDGSVLLKPIDYNDAKAMWQSMSNTVHQVWTSVQATLVKKTMIKKSANKRADNYRIIWQDSLLEQTSVYFIQLNHADMQAYWQTGEPMDKAGAYAIQGRGAAWVRRIEGSYTNVVGLPLAQTKILIDNALLHI